MVLGLGSEIRPRLLASHWKQKATCSLPAQFHFDCRQLQFFRNRPVGLWSLPWTLSFIIIIIMLVALLSDTVQRWGHKSPTRAMLLALRSDGPLFESTRVLTFRISSGLRVVWHTSTRLSFFVCAVWDVCCQEFLRVFVLDRSHLHRHPYPNPRDVCFGGSLQCRGWPFLLWGLALP